MDDSMSDIAPNKIHHLRECPFGGSPDNSRQYT